MSVDSIVIVIVIVIHLSLSMYDWAGPGAARCRGIARGAHSRSIDAGLH